ncbi:MAG: sigma 54-interacting transcriptional regulator [Nitrospirota bacterium]|nr:sigma 54-interacting transcriptional regulator [Nitrospirota bacterium]
MSDQNPSFLPVLSSWTDPSVHVAQSVLEISENPFPGSDPRIILESLEEGVVAIGLDKKVLYMNRAAREILGMPEGNFAGVDCHKVMRTAVCSARCLLEKTIETGEAFRNYEIALSDHKKQTHLVRVNTALLRDPSGQVIGGVEIFHDVTQLAALRKELKGRYSFGRIIGQSEKMRELFDLLPVIAQSKSTVLIEGESGTGKELVAHAIHEMSPRKDGPFIKVNCAALSEGVLESELFGHVRGAFTGAVQSKPGRFEMASGGSIFLDEIGEISPSMQVKLLRVLQEEEFERVGGTKTLKVDVRVIAATNRDLKKAIETGEFRKDLYYRLRVVPLFLPPLRDRREDIPLLISSFLDRYNAEFGKNIEGLTQGALDVLLNYSYPGNVRELQNIMEHAVLLSSERMIDVKNLPRDLWAPSGEKTFLEEILSLPQPLKNVEDALIQKALERTNGNMSEAAKLLGIGRSTLWRRLKEKDQVQ